MKTGKMLALAFVATIFQIVVHAQEIVNIVLVGNDGITQNIKEAQSFILVKKYPGSVFERLDYHLGEPLELLRSYNDSNLNELQGAYLEYHPNGLLRVRGQYRKNQKVDDWYYYNDTSKHILTETYKEDILVKTELPDTVKKLTDTVTYKDEREANLKGGTKAWITYIQKNLNADVAQQSKTGGQVRVLFRINTAGNPVDIYLKKSVEFVLDEEALRVIRNSPKWIPAFQNGKALNAYRIQPVTFIKD